MRPLPPVLAGLKVNTTNRPLQHDDIVRLEEVVGCPLPEQYRIFLLEHNGGRPKPDIIDIDGAPFEGTVIHVLHGIETEIRSSDIMWNWETLDGCKVSLVLPIAHDSLGHTFGLVLGEDDYGHVYYFDSREEPPRPYFVARDFNEFLSKIRDLTPEEQADIDALVRESSSDGG